MEKVLITGASGFIGYHLIEAAAKEDFEVVAAVRSRSVIDHLRHFNNIQFCHLDYTNVPSLVKELEDRQYDYIIHAAGATKARTQQEYNTVNAVYTRNLALATKRSSILLKKFIFISSLAALGPYPGSSAAMLQDDTCPQPVTAYGKSKLLAEQYLLEIDELPLIVLRPTAVYGPRECNILIMLKAIKKGLELYIGNHKQQLSFIHASDLAAVAMKALHTPVSTKSYNASDGHTYSRYDLADISKRILRKRTLRAHLPITLTSKTLGILDKIYALSGKASIVNQDKLHDLTAANWACSTENLKKDLGFLPLFDLESGLMQTLNWYKENKWL